MLAFAAAMEKMERHGGCGVAAAGCVNGGCGIAHDFYFPRIMTVPISESNPKIQCQYVLLKPIFFLIKTNRKQN